MPEKGGIPYDQSLYERQALRAQLCNLATDHCYEHGAAVVDEILSRFHVTPKSIKEMKAS